MTAYAGAIEEFGYRYLETDVRKTRDGVVVMFHDATLDRTTNGVGAIADWLWEDLRHLDAAWSFGEEQGYPLRSTGVHIPRLEEVFGTWPGIHVNIDLKAPGMEWAVAETIVRARRREQALVASFVDARIARFRRITQGDVATSAGTALATAAWVASRVGRPVPRQPDAYQMPFQARGARLDRRFVDAAHAAGAQVHAWVVNQRDDMERLLEIGVDGIVTDLPDVLNEVIAARAGDG